MKHIGIITWAIVLTYLFANGIFWYIWGSVIAFCLGVYIYAIVKNSKKR